MSSEDIPRIRLSSPGDIAQIVPYLVGFQPEDSLVIVVVDRGVVAVTARVDLDQVQHPQDLTQIIGRIWSRFPGAGAILMAYTSDHDIGWDTLSRADAHLPWQADRQLMLVDGNSWHQPDGTAGVIDRYGPLATQATLGGLGKLEHRADLATRLASAEQTDELSDKVTEVLDRLPEPGDNRRLVSRISELLVANLPERVGSRRAQTVSSEDAISMAILSQNPAARDVALLAMTRETAAQHLQLWCDVVNRTPAYGSEQPLHLAGMAAWLAGEGALASIALERAEAMALPGDLTRTGILSRLIDQVVPPSTWDTLRGEALANVNALVRAGVANVTPPASEAWESVDPPTHTTRHAPRDTAPPAPGIAI